MDGTALTTDIMISGIVHGTIRPGLTTATRVHSVITTDHPGITDGVVLTITGIVHTAAAGTITTTVITTVATHPTTARTGTGTITEIQTRLS